MGGRAARHDWVVMSDSNVLVPPDYLDRLFARWTDDTAFVCSPPVGVAGEGPGGRLEMAFLNTFQARWQLAVDALGMGFVQGKTILMRRGDIEAEGGIRALATEAAEDAAATKIARRQHRAVHLVDRPFPQPLGYRSLSAAWQRQLRWARLRRGSFPLLFAAEILAGAFMPVTLYALLATPGTLPWLGLAVLVYAWYGAEAVLARASHWPLTKASPLFWIARDLMLPALWLVAWTGSSFTWRGHAMTATVEAGAKS
jgi:ceramide glucosyltransferase